LGKYTDRARMLRSLIEKSALSLSDDEALAAPELYPKWSSFIGRSLDAGIKVFYEGDLWVTRQQINTVLENQFPSTGTAALYKRLDETHAGTAEDPIPYDMNLEVFSGKIYKENDILYTCIRDSGQPLYAKCSDLVGNYFKVYEEPVEEPVNNGSESTQEEDPANNENEPTQEPDIPEFVQPDSTNPYMKGDMVRWNGEVYKSLIDNNVWSPYGYPSGWQIVA
jgi:hypothetical protein